MPTLGRDAATAYLDIVRRRRSSKMRREKWIKRLTIALMAAAIQAIICAVSILVYQAIR